MDLDKLRMAGVRAREDAVVAHLQSLGLVESPKEEAAAHGMSKPKVIVICGSTRFIQIMAVVAWLLERDENAIVMGLHLLPGWYSLTPIPDHLAEYEGCADRLDMLHRAKIDLADEIMVVDWDGYIGESTAKEIAYTQATGKKVRYLREEPLAKEVASRIIAAAKAQKEKP